MSRPFPVAKRGVRFFIDADAKCVAQSRQIDWYLQWWIKRYKEWEDRTFIILDTFLDARRSFIDVGAWIGPTVLYGAAKAQHIYCFEPDPEAYRVLMRSNRSRRAEVSGPALGSSFDPETKFYKTDGTTPRNGRLRLRLM